MEILQPKTIAQALLQKGSSDSREEVCEKHGPYVSRMYLRARWTTCEKCMEERHAEDMKQRAESAERERKELRLRKLFGRAAIPERFRERSLDSFVPHCDGARKALHIATAYAENFETAAQEGSSLIFCGGVGAGKTHLACGIARKLIEREYIAVFTSVLAAVRSVKESWRKDSPDTESVAIQKLVEPDLLILDEVGVQFGSDTEKLFMFEIINGRYEQLKPTIVISNLAKADLEAFLGERVMDRLREGGGRMVIFDWPSYRRSA